MSNIIYKDESYNIVGVLFEVHNNLGSGFSEIVYKDALEYEFNILNIPFQREKEFTVSYKDIKNTNFMLILWSLIKSF